MILRKILIPLTIILLAPQTGSANNDDDVSSDFFFDDLYSSKHIGANVTDTLSVDTTLNVTDMTLPKRLFGKLVYDRFRLTRDSVSIKKDNDNPLYNWISRQKRLQNDITMLRQRTMFSNPSLAVYNENLLPDPP